MVMHMSNVSYNHFDESSKHIFILILLLPGTNERSNDGDCRQTGCTVGECVRQGLRYICKQGK